MKTINSAGRISADKKDGVMYKKGFTLLEIMIVVAIIGVIAAIGIPVIIREMERAEVKAKARNIQDVLRAKGVSCLPTDVGGDNAKPGDDVSTNVFRHLRGVTATGDLKVGSSPLTVGVIGVDPSYD